MLLLVEKDFLLLELLDEILWFFLLEYAIDLLVSSFIVW